MLIYLDKQRNSVSYSVVDRHFVVGGSGISDSKLWSSDRMVLVQGGLLRLHLAICFLLRTSVVFSFI